MAIGPQSEVYGRKPILHASNVWFLVWNVVCGFSNSKELLIASPFLAGFGASAIYSLAGGVLGDVWRPEQRGKSLSIYLLIPLLGAAVFKTYHWRLHGRTHHLAMDVLGDFHFQAVMIAVSFASFHETYAPVILKRRAEHLRDSTSNAGYYTAEERREASKSVVNVVGRALSQPMRLLAFQTIIQLTSLLSAFNYGSLYIVVSTYSGVRTGSYHQSVEISGLHYIACAMGELAGSQLAGLLIDRLYSRAGAAARLPEYCVLVMIPGAMIMSAGLLVYGWTVQHKAPWPAVDVGIVLATLGMQVSSMGANAYRIDAYPDHTGLAMAASQFLMSLTAFLFPLFAPMMYARLGYGWGNTMIAFVGLAISVPAPLILWKYGEGLRKRARSTY